MYTSRTRLLILACAAGLLLAGCGKPATDDSKVLATVNGEPITEKEYTDFVSHLPGPVHPDKTKEKEMVLDEMSKRILLAQWAADQKLDKDPDVAIALKRQRENLLVNAATRKILKDAGTVTEEDIKKRYEQEVAKTHKTEYHVLHIVVDTEDKAKALIAQVKGGTDFAALAKKESKGPTKDKGGDLGWLQQGVVVPEFFDAVVKLKKGEYTAEPVKTQFGYHVIKVADSRPLQIPPFDKVKSNVARLIQQERIDNQITEIKKKASIKTN